MLILILKIKNQDNKRLISTSKKEKAQYIHYINKYNILCMYIWLQVFDLFNDFINLFIYFFILCVWAVPYQARKKKSNTINKQNVYDFIEATIYRLIKMKI